MNKNIENLKAQIEAEERKIANCKHIFEAAFYNPETIKEPSDFKIEAHGSDVWSVATNYRDVTKDRWTRICTICGMAQHTYKQEPIILGYKPFF